MPYAALALVASVTLAQGRAPLSSSPWQFDPYARQLGAVHFPGGEAALDDRIAAVAVFPDGAAVVGGFTYGSLGEAHAGPSNTTDLFVARFGALGNLEWVRQVGAVTAPTIPALNGNPGGPGGDATGFDGVSDLAIAPDGSILFTGWTGGSLGETSAGQGDVIVGKLSATGSLLSLRQLGAQTAPTIVPPPGATQWGDASSGDRTTSIVLLPGGDLVVGGSTLSSLGEDHAGFSENFFLARFDGAGALQWLRQIGEITGPSIGFSTSGSDELDELALHPNGKIVMIGTSWSATGTLYIERPRVFLFDAAGAPLDWDELGGAGTSRLSGVAIHAPTGQILVGGRIYSWFDQPLPSDVLAACYDANLNIQWVRRVDASTTGHLAPIDLSRDDVATCVALDAAGNLVLAGTTEGSLNETNGGQSDVFTMRVRRTDGFVLSMAQIGQATAASEGLQVNNAEAVGSNGFARGPAGTFVLGGWTSSRFAEPRGGLDDALLLRLDPLGRLR